MISADLVRLSKEYYDAAELERRSQERREQKFKEYQDLLRDAVDQPLRATFLFRRAGHWDHDNGRLHYAIDLGYDAHVERQMVRILHVGEKAVYLCSLLAMRPAIQGVVEVSYEHFEIHPDEDALVD